MKVFGGAETQISEDETQLNSCCCVWPVTWTSKDRMLVFLTGCDEADSTGQENRKRASIAATAKYHHGQVEKPHWVKSEGTGSKSSSGNETGSTEEGSAPSPSSNPALSSISRAHSRAAGKAETCFASSSTQQSREGEGGRYKAEWKELNTRHKNVMYSKGNLRKENHSQTREVKNEESILVLGRPGNCPQLLKHWSVEFISYSLLGFWDNKYIRRFW